MLSRISIRTACLLALSVLLCQRAQADGLIRDGIGAISIGRGGTNQGFADNGAILLDNPAGMMNVCGDGLCDIGIDTLATDIHYTDADPNDTLAYVRPLPLPMFSYIRRSPDSDWAWGIGGFVPGGFEANYNMINPIVGPAAYKAIGGLGKLVPGVACRLTDDLSIGGTIGLAISHAELEGPYFVQTGVLTGVPTIMDLQTTGAAPTGSLGLQYRVSEKTMLGVTYTTESRFVLDGHTNVAIFGVAPQPVLSTFDTKLDLVWPRSLALGLKHDLCPHRRIGADVIWYDWSHAFDQIDLKLTNSTNPLIPQLVGPQINDTIPLRWHDTVSLRLGYEWEPTDDDIWRIGYIYHDSPAPNETLTPYLDGVLEHCFSIGYSRRLQRAILNFAYQYSYGPKRYVNQSDLVGGDFSNSTFDAQAHWGSVSVLVPF